MPYNQIGTRQGPNNMGFSPPPPQLWLGYGLTVWKPHSDLNLPFRELIAHHGGVFQADDGSILCRPANKQTNKQNVTSTSQEMS